MSIKINTAKAHFNASLTHLKTAYFFLIRHVIALRVYSDNPG